MRQEKSLRKDTLQCIFERFLAGVGEMVGKRKLAQETTPGGDGVLVVRSNWILYLFEGMTDRLCLQI